MILRLVFIAVYCLIVVAPLVLVAVAPVVVFERIQSYRLILVIRSLLLAVVAAIGAYYIILLW